MEATPKLRPQSPPDPAPKPRRRWLETSLAILVGVVLGLAVISAFVFLGSEGSIDAPRISGVDTGKPGTQPSPGHEPASSRP